MAEMREKTRVEAIDRTVYDIRDESADAYRIQAGLTPAIVEKISAEKKDPDWMREFRLHALDIYDHTAVPDWAPRWTGWRWTTS